MLKHTCQESHLSFSILFMTTDRPKRQPFPKNSNDSIFSPCLHLRSLLRLRLLLRRS
jgi:hypothetical protein